jgi:hypothetical protein
MSSPSYPAFLQNIGKLLSGAPRIFHAPLHQDENDMESFKAGVTECVNAYFSSTLSSTTYLGDKWDRCIEEAANDPNAGYKGTFYRALPLASFFPMIYAYLSLYRYDRRVLG